jgi:RNA polymerase sigma factor (sigma-70 family)
MPGAGDEVVPVAGSLDDLLPAIGAGDATAFARWLAGTEGRLRDSLRSFAARVDTEAVLQEALIRVWQVAPRFVPDGRPDGLVRLAIRIARNVAVSELRRNRLDPVEIEALERAADDRDELPPGPADPMLRRTIEDCRRHLPARPAAALAARLQSGGSVPDERLAERLGMRTNTFLQNITRARRLLAECLRRRGVDLAMEMA